MTLVGWQFARTPEAEGSSEGVEHIQEELVVLAQQVPNSLLGQPWAVPQEARHRLWF